MYPPSTLERHQPHASIREMRREVHTCVSPLSLPSPIPALPIPSTPWHREKPHGRIRTPTKSIFSKVFLSAEVQPNPSSSIHPAATAGARGYWRGTVKKTSLGDVKSIKKGLRGRFSRSNLSGTGPSLLAGPPRPQDEHEERKSKFTRRVCGGKKYRVACSFRGRGWLRIIKVDPYIRVTYISQYHLSLHSRYNTFN